VPKSYDHAMRLDQRNGNTLWSDAIKLELTQINEYDTFIDKGHHTKTTPPSGYKKIRVHLVFDVKHDGRHKARLVADGHLTDIPLESVYSGVVSLRGFRLVIFLAELNNLQLWATDIGNAYLEAYTSEKVYIIAGPEFSGLEGHILIINKALYGLRSSGARWHDRFADCVREMGFFPCKAEPDIWMRKKNNLYEYIAVYVDDLAVAMINPKEFMDTLENKYKFKLKGTGPITFHLGMDFTRDDDGILCISPAKYIDKLIMNYEKLFGQKPSTSVTSPLEKGDHPELDDSELCDTGQIELYQSMIGSLQWIVTIGRFDIHTAVMTMSGFRMAPRIGHLKRLRRIYGYLAKMRHASIRVRTQEPDYSDIPDEVYDWTYSVYGNVQEYLPADAPEPLGNHVTTTHYVDANLMHDITTGRSVTGILHFVNKTPIEWYSKKQSTVETATYGSEFVASRICVEQIIDLRNTLRYLGVPIQTRSYMFGDNKSVVDSSMNVYSKLHKRHTMLSYHRVREAIASGTLIYHYLPGDLNPADIMSKHWGYSQVKDRLKTLLFWKGDTGMID
jgi:Reverse transcriptase (RNA-dependent DNA polymerase)